MRSKPSEHDVNAALDYVWEQFQEKNPQRSDESDRNKELRRQMWRELALEQVELVLEYAYNHPRIRTLEEHLDGWAPSNLQHHLSFQHTPDPSWTGKWAERWTWDELHRKLHEEGQTHPNVEQP